MSVLTKQEMNALNRSMLGLGEPVEIDNKGYNQSDFMSMKYLAERESLTNSDLYRMAGSLLHYANTQLVNYATDLKETFEYYKALAKEITVVDFNSKGIQLSWDYDRKVSDYIKYDMERSHYKWFKSSDGWVLTVYWNYVDELVKVFQENDFDVASILSVEKPEAEEISDDDCEKVVLEVARSKKSVDTLLISSGYNPKLVEVYHSIPNTWFNKNDKTWECYIENAEVLYEGLKGIKSVDATQLKPWADMVKDWKKSYELIDWTKMPLKFKPYNFQIEDAKKLLSQQVMLNANDMGAGKTFEQVLVGESIPMKKLVICPPTLRLNWKREILHVNPNAEVHIIYSADEFKTVDEWNIIGYSSLDKFQEQLEAEKFQVLMVDEAHYIQAINNNGTPDSKRAWGVLRLAATAGFVYPITGTPKTNRNKNLFNILKIIRHPLTRGKYAFSNYGQRYCAGTRNSWGWDYEGNSNDTELNDKLVPFMVRHLKSEVLPNLKKQRIVTPVSVDLQEYHYEISEYLKNRTNKKAEDLARLMRARKVLAIQKAGESIDFAKNIISQNQKIVIVTCFTDVVKAIEKAFKGNCVKLVGGMSDSAKDEAINNFQTGEPQVMVMNIIAGGVGVTLTRSHNMIINDFDWTPGNITQAEDRICRGGQTECCNIYYMTADGADMDEVFTETLTEKFVTINSAVDNGDGDEIDFLDLLNRALEKSTGVNKVRKMVKTNSDGKGSEEEIDNSLESVQSNLKAGFDPSGKTIEELFSIAEEIGAVYKQYDNQRIQRMRLVMAIKKKLEQ